MSTSSVLYAIQATAIERNMVTDVQPMTLVNEPLCMVEATSFSSKRATHTKALFALGHSYFDSAMDLTAKPLPIDTTRHHRLVNRAWLKKMRSLIKATHQV
ncbi:MAG: hypothetical protein ACJASB_001910 [Shewanella psychromarinicola]|uniref:hypothetical protein n=1 Tax=Shewanella psychromarinicola TaxID=2487742 RepID=UPI003EEF44D2